MSRNLQKPNDNEKSDRVEARRNLTVVSLWKYQLTCDYVIVDLGLRTVVCQVLFK
jgi:hypothetical protein